MSEGEGGAPAAPGDLQALLARSRRVFLLSLRDDGSPTAHPMTGIFTEGRLGFSTYGKSAKAKNLRRDPRACCLALPAGYDGGPDDAVLYRGRARVVSAEEQAARAAPRGAAAGDVPSAVSQRAQERMASGKRVFIEVSPDEVHRLDGER